MLLIGNVILKAPDFVDDIPITAVCRFQNEDAVSRLRVPQQQAAGLCIRETAQLKCDDSLRSLGNDAVHLTGDMRCRRTWYR